MMAAGVGTEAAAGGGAGAIGDEVAAAAGGGKADGAVAGPAASGRAETVVETAGAVDNEDAGRAAIDGSNSAARAFFDEGGEAVASKVASRNRFSTEPRLTVLIPRPPHARRD
jgi:hypothetical protein